MSPVKSSKIHAHCINMKSKTMKSDTKKSLPMKYNTKKSHQINSFQMKNKPKNPIILTHKGVSLKEISHHIAPTQIETCTKEFNDLFLDIFHDDNNITDSTQKLIEKANEKIQQKQDEQNEIENKIEKLDNDWNILRTDILSHKYQTQEYNDDLDYNQFLSNFQDSKLLQCESLKKSEETKNNIIKYTQQIKSAESVDRLETTIKNEEIQKPDYFMIPQEYFKTESIQDGKPLEFHIESDFKFEETIHYICEIWPIEFKKIPKHEKNTQFDKLLGHFLNVKLNAILIKSFFEHLLMFSRYNSEYFNDKIIILLKNLIKPYSENSQYDNSKISTVLLILSKICPTSFKFSSLFELSFQLCVFMLSINKCDHDISLNYCGVLYEFCRNSSKFCPEVISFFSRFQKAETYDPSFLSKLLKILICYMKLWRNLCCYNTIFNFTESFIKRVDHYLEIQEFVYISNELKSLLKENPSEPLNNNFIIKKKKILMQYDPLIIEIKPHDNKPSEKIKMLKRLKKREHRGAVRNLRRETETRARRQISEVIRNDEDRKNRVKELFKDISRERAN